MKDVKYSDQFLDYWAVTGQWLTTSIYGATKLMK
jgi:hypothetical protein